MFELFKIMGTIGVDNSDANKSLDDTDKKASSTSKSMGQSFMDGAVKVGKAMTTAGKFMTTWITGPLLAVGTGMGVAAMDLEATEAKYNTVFDGMTGQSDEFIKKFQKLTPATTAEARSMASGIQDLLIPMGMARDEATDMSGDMMHLTGALANFNSGTHSATDVSSAFQSAILGQYEPLKSLGIQLSKTEVEQRALEDGLADSAEELTKADLAQTMMTMAYEQSGDALNAYTEENLDAKTKMGLMKAEIIDVAAQFGQVLLPIISDVIDYVRQGVEWFGNMSEEQQKMALVIGAVVAAIGPLLLVVGKILIVLPQLVTGLKLVGGVFAFLTSPIGLTIAAIAAVIAIGVLLWKNWDTVKEKGLEIWGQIVDFIFGFLLDIEAKFLGFMDSALSWVADTWNQVYDIWIGWISSIFDSNNKYFGDILDSIDGIMMGIWMVIESIWAYITGTFENAVGFILALISGDFATMKDMAGEQLTLMMQTASDIWNSIMEIFSSAGSYIVSIIKASFQEAYDNVKGIITDIQNSIIGTFNDIFSSIHNIMMRIREVMFDIFMNIVDKVSELMRKIFGYTNDNFNKMQKSIRDIMYSIWDIIMAVWNYIYDTFKNTINFLKALVKGDFKGMYDSIKEQMNNVLSTITSIWNSVKSIVSNVLSAIWSLIRGIMQNIYNTIKDKLNSAKNFFSTAFNSMKSTVSSVLGSAYSIVSRIFNNIKTKITTTINAAKEAVRKAIEAIKGFFNFQWKLPKLKMPKFSVSGSKNPIDWITQGVPKLKVDWFAKGGIMQKATAFGMNGDSLQVGGEAGREAVLPLNKSNLAGIGAGIAQASGFNNDNVVRYLYELIQEVKRLADNPVFVEIDVDGKRITKVLANPMRKEIEKLDTRDSIIKKGRRDK